MNRLQAELQRLYFSEATAASSAAPGTAVAALGDQRTRAMVLEAALPAGWRALAKVWRGVQAEMELAAPAIAVSGVHGLQLWFSLARPVPVAQALAFLQALARRYLDDVAPDRVTMHVSVDVSERAAPLASGDAQPPCQAPPREAAPGQWSAFVAPDLAALFADEPWLDLAPSPEAQAELLSALQSIDPADLQRAKAQLAPVAPPPAPAGPARSSQAAPALDSPAQAAAHSRHFLLQVMNDPAVDLALRIEAAKALLPCFDGPRSL